MNGPTARDYAGALLKDLGRYVRAVRGRGDDWLKLCNRTEKVTSDPNGPGVRCDWKWSSPLHAPQVLPFLGRALLRRAFREYSLSLAEEPPVGSGEKPDITFVLGHRGVERLSHLKLVIKSIAAQRGVRVECVVIEESESPKIADSLPHWVRYRHIATERIDSPYNRSRTFNVGATMASAPYLVLHDNDMLVPETYASEMLVRRDQGFAVANIKRFIFYLRKQHAMRVFLRDAMDLNGSPDFVLQNLTGGGSIGVERAAFDKLGGMDEGFVGWGGEDVEFWDRAQTLPVWNYGYMPLVHLWHEPQPGKTSAKDTPGMRRLDDVLAIPTSERIQRLNLERTR